MRTWWHTGAEEDAQGITIQVARGATADDTRVHSEGSIDLGQSLGFGGVVAAMDEWQAKRGDQAKPAYQYQPLPNSGGCWGRGWAHPISAHVDDSALVPTGLRRHIWDNLASNIKNHFATSLTEEVTLTDSVEMSTKLTIGASLTTSVEVTGGPVKAGASATYSVQAEVGKTQTHSRSVSVGSTDSADAELPPHSAELLVLSSLEGPMSVKVLVQTTWLGGLQWRYGPGHPWQTMTSWDFVLDHGLARPGDPRGVHSGLAEISIGVGTVSEVDQTAVSVPDLSKTTLDKAVAGILAERWPSLPSVASRSPKNGRLTPVG